MSRKKQDENVLLIKNAWDAYHESYMKFILQKRPDFFEFFRCGGVDDDFEFSLLGSVKGLKLLDTCCACDARQSFSWANLGAQVTACDISPVAINIAKSNADLIGLRIDFQVTDAQILNPIPDNEYDIVYATYIVWYEDLLKACLSWYRVLKPGGRLLLIVNHPITDCLEEKGDCLFSAYNYHDRSPDYYQWKGTPVGREFGFSTDLTTVFHHTLADIVNSIATAGFRIEMMVETENIDDNSTLSKLPRDLAIIARK